MAADPYKPLFPLGTIAGVLGVGIWLMHHLGWVPFPMIEHAYVMIFGFFLSFVSGFLMTALPRMSGSPHASSGERHTAVALISSGVLCAFTQQFAWAYGLAALQSLFLLIFAGRRFRLRKQNPPRAFFFVPTALLWSITGSVILSLIYLNIAIPAVLHQLARVAVQEAFLLLLIVGLGSRLIPFLTRVQRVDPMTMVKEARWPIYTVFALLNAGFLLEGFGYHKSGAMLLAGALGVASIHLFKMNLPRHEGGYLGFGLRASVVVMFLGYVGLALVPQYRLALLHFIFIGGFTLITIMVATRVVLAHGGFSLELENKSRFVAAAIMLLTIAAFFRSFYFLPTAATLWLLATALWFYGIGRLAFR